MSQAAQPGWARTAPLNGPENLQHGVVSVRRWQDSDRSDNHAFPHTARSVPWRVLTRGWGLTH
ncbi:MAG: hypothetical protein MZV64_04810 [Ignavibacteriales bacterium]|nr:hypothetical protein [Ignavibacteriales bacterium]